MPTGERRQAAHTWDWPHDVEHFPEDAPLQALLLTATRLMGAYAQCTVQAAGLKISLAGLGVLRVLMDTDGLKSSEVADRGWSSPGTVSLRSLTSLSHFLMCGSPARKTKSDSSSQGTQARRTAPGEAATAGPGAVLACSGS